MTEVIAPDLRARLEEERALAASTYPLDKLVDTLEERGRATISGAGESYIALVLADLASKMRRPLAIVVPRGRDARELHDALSTFLRSERRLVLLPGPDVSPYAGVTPDRNVMMQRLSATRDAGLLRGGDLLVSSAVGWARRIVPSEMLDAYSGVVTEDGEVDLEELRTQLLAAGYASVSLVEDPGTFSIRGGLLDIYSPHEELPVRIELYGDMVDTMRLFDPKTQRSGDSVTEYAFTPIREEILGDEGLGHARDRLMQLGEDLRVPSNKVGAILRDLQAGVRFFGIEGLLPAFYDELVPLEQRLPDNAVVVFIEPDAILETIQGNRVAREREAARELENGELCFPVSSFFRSEEEVQADFDGFAPRIAVRALTLEDDGTTVRFPHVDNSDVVRLRKARAGGDGAVHAVAEYVASWQDRYGRVALVCATRGSADRLTQLLESYGASVVRRADRLDVGQPAAPPCDAIEVVLGNLRSGFRSPSLSLAVLTELEVLGRTHRRASRELAEEATAISSFKDLTVGDLIVHIDFGIGKYRGLERMDAGGVEHDFLAIEYADNDRLYVPVYRLGRVQKYVGSVAFTRLDKLGGTSWEKTKERVKRQLADIAEELLKVYAERQSRRGHQFRAPSDMYREFEAAFPYEETPHQADAIEDVIHDMTSKRPMDRLLCGDVGFGKTEVAIRAAFKAVEDGKQVAVLVPTTVLAEQHVKSFRDRLAETAARIEGLSRFRTSKEVKEILRDLGEGKVDIVVGTHRLLSKDLEFADLGLLIVDEEQRFGVTHKEKIKQLRASIDVLTMTATPIPRTLELSLLGIRDLSVILTPPPGRLAVRTNLAKFKDSVLREAIGRELDRGGQIFFVHNRVETIHNIAETIRKCVPTAKVIVGHAQMKDTELENVMTRFLKREADVLVSTTIIESGLDIGNANTILINEAHRFGLSQLHQLRGRVGRGSEQAYCYLLVKDPKKLTADGKRRLDVLQQHSELGSGIQIAHHDLDMRGAGNILGSDQSGHIEAVGFELFSELLDEAIADMRGEVRDESLEPEVKLPIAAYIPENYVTDVSQRLAFYKRYSMATDEEQLFDVHAELQDRYGRAPDEVEALKNIVHLKLDMRRMRGKQLEAGPKGIVVELMEDTRLDPGKVIALIKSKPGTWEFRPPMTVKRSLRGAESKDLMGVALRTARELLECMA